MPNAHDERHHAQLTGTRRSLTERLRRVLGPYVLIAPAAGAQVRERAAEQWRAQKPDELKNWQAFKPGS